LEFTGTGDEATSNINVKKNKDALGNRARGISDTISGAE
jgi:hypothetical protein